MAKEATRKLGDSIPPLRDHGVEHLVAANKGGQALQGGLVTQAGAAPFTLIFADHGLADMADLNYAVIASVEGAAATADESTKTTTQVDILLGSDTDIINLLIFGRQAGMAPAPEDL